MPLGPPPSQLARRWRSVCNPKQPARAWVRGYGKVFDDAIWSPLCWQAITKRGKNHHLRWILIRSLLTTWQGRTWRGGEWARVLQRTLLMRELGTSGKPCRPLKANCHHTMRPVRLKKLSLAFILRRKGLRRGFVSGKRMVIPLPSAMGFIVGSPLQPLELHPCSERCTDHLGRFFEPQLSAPSDWWSSGVSRIRKIPYLRRRTQSTVAEPGISWRFGCGGRNIPSFNGPQDLWRFLQGQCRIAEIELVLGEVNLSKSFGGFMCWAQEWNGRQLFQGKRIRWRVWGSSRVCPHVPLSTA